jgi:hypothetical protein
MGQLGRCSKLLRHKLACKTCWHVGSFVLLCIDEWAAWLASLVCGLVQLICCCSEPKDCDRYGTLSATAVPFAVEPWLKHLHSGML